MAVVSLDTEYIALTGLVSSGEVLLQISITLSCSGNEGTLMCEDVALTPLLIDTGLSSCKINPDNMFLSATVLHLSVILAKERRSKGTSATETENALLNT
jgi:hypothetical protein